MTALAVALAQLRDRPLQAALNALLMALGVAGLIALILLSRQTEERMVRDLEGVDMVVGAKGSPLQLVLSSVFHVDVPTGNVKLSEIKALERDRRVAELIPLALGDSYRGVRIVGAPPAYLDHYGAELAAGAVYSRPLEAVLGSRAAQETGLKIGDTFEGAHGLGLGGATHAHAPFTVTGVLKPSRTALDNLIITPVESVWAAHGQFVVASPIPHPGERAAERHEDNHDEHERTHERKTNENQTETNGISADLIAQTDEPPAHAAARHDDGLEITAALVTFASPAAAITLRRDINENTAMMAASPAIEFTRLNALMGGGLAAMQGFALILAGSAAVGVFVSLFSGLRERRGDLALMRVMGASPGVVFGSILAEGAITAAAGAVLGLLLGHGAAEIIAQHSPPLASMGVSGYVWYHMEAAVIAGALALGLLGALLPAALGYGQDLDAALRS